MYQYITKIIYFASTTYYLYHHERPYMRQFILVFFRVRLNCCLCVDEQKEKRVNSLLTHYRTKNAL